MLTVFNPPASDWEIDRTTAQPHFFGLIDGYEDVAAKAFRKVATFPDERMRRAGLSILSKLRNATRRQIGTPLPTIQVFMPDDGSLWIEWTSKYWRIGFTIERDAAESGWYLVSDSAHGDLRASGALSKVDVNWLADWARSNL